MVHISSPLLYFHLEILKFWYAFALLPSMPPTFENNYVTSILEGKIQLKNNYFHFIIF
jgi:hypothetical protein